MAKAKEALWTKHFSTYDGGVDYFIKRLKELAASYGGGFTEVNVFEDFLEAAYCAMSKAAWLTLMQTKKAEAQEARFAALEKQRKPGWLQSLGELLGIATATLSIAYGDFFGDIASRLSVLSSGLGQFFTPYALCQLMVSISLPVAEVEKKIKKEGLVTVSEPASGGGAQLVAVADTLVSAIKSGSPIVLHRDVYVEANDVSALAFKMTYITASLVGLSACIRHADTLTLEVYETAFTPTFWHLYTNPAFLRRLRGKESDVISLRTGKVEKSPFRFMRAVGRDLRKSSSAPKGRMG